MAALGALSKCRLCLKLGDFYSIFAEDNSIQLARMAMACSEVKIFEGDGLPDKICSECVEKLSSAFIFKQQCERSDAELRKSFKPNITITAVHGNQSTENDERRQRSLKRNRGEDIITKYSPTANLLEESYSVDVSDTLSFENTHPMNIKIRRLSDSSSVSLASTTKKKIKCELCFATFKTNKGKSSHMRSHKRDELAKTNVGANNSSQGLNVTKDASFTCKHCEHTCVKKYIFAKHLRDCPGNESGEFECPNCTRVFKKRFHLVFHLEKNLECGGESKTNSKNQKPQCSNCDMELTSYMAMLRHFYKCVEVNGLKKMSCITCDLNYLNRKAFVKHIRLVHIYSEENGGAPQAWTILKPAMNNSFKCHKCFMVFDNQFKLATHISKHLNNVDIRPKNSSKFAIPYKCPKCNKKFRFKSSIINHMKSHRDTMTIKQEFEESNNTCDLCDKSFQYAKSLAIHKKKKHTMQVVSMEIADGIEGDDKSAFNYSKLSSRCLHCNLILSNKRERKLHNQVHIKMNEKPKNEYMCPQCSMKFTNTKTFQIHYKVHEGEVKDEAEDEEEVFDASITNFCEVTSDLPNDCDTVEIEFVPELEYDNDQSQTSIASIGYTCTICNESLKSLKTYQGHMRLHERDTNSEQNLITCMVCDEEFYDENEHRQHMKEHYNDKNIDTSLLVCKLCNKPSKNMRSYIAHISWHSNSGTFQCYLCNKTFPYSNYYAKHMKGFHNVSIKDMGMATKHKCHICKKYFDTHNSLQYHITCHKRGQQASNNKKKVEFKCTHCNKQFVAKYALVTHMLTNHNIQIDIANPELLTDKKLKSGKFHCSFCDLVFATQGGYYKHLSNIHPDRKHLIVKSSKSIMEIAPLEPIKIERIEIDTESMKANQCVFCQKYFNSPEELQEHIPVHNLTPNLFKCTICCKKSATMKMHLLHLTKLHLQQYHLSNPLKCENCDKKFIRRQELRTHLQNDHDIIEDYVTKLDKDDAIEPTDLKDKQCHICEKILSSESTYQRHLMWHNERRCNYCCKYFNSKGFVATHVKYHCEKKKVLGNSDQYEKKMKCHVCLKPFSVAIKLYCHLKVQHNAEPDSNSGVKKVSPCDFCFSVFHCEEKMLSHRKSHFYVSILKCKFCEKALRPIQFKKHKVQHYSESFEDNPITCEHCDENFTTIRSYSNHLTLVHNETLVWSEVLDNPSEKCNICNKEFANLQRHLMYHEKYKCKKCLKHFYSEILFGEHVCEIESDDEMDKKVKVETDASDADWVEECDFCFKPFTGQNCKSKHNYNHYNNQSYGCRLCSKRFSMKSTLKYHFASHRNQKFNDNPLQCRICSTTFNRHQEYFDHLKVEHNINETLDYRAEFPAVECLICKKSFSNIYRHYKYHQDIQCGQCYKYFLSHQAYMDHDCGKSTVNPDTAVEFDGDLMSLTIADYKPFEIKRLYDGNNKMINTIEEDSSYNHTDFSAVAIKSDLDSSMVSNGDNMSQTSFDNFSPVISSTISLSSAGNENKEGEECDIFIKSEPIDHHYNYMDHGLNET